MDLPAEAIEALADLPSRLAGGLVFPGRDGRPWNEETIRNRLRNLCERLGLPEMTPHQLRHAHGTYMALSGVHQKVAMQRLGHGSVTMTQRYIHLAGEQQQAAAEAVAAALRKPKRAPTVQSSEETPTPERETA